MKKRIIFHLAVLMLLRAVGVDAASPANAGLPKKEDIRGLANLSPRVFGNWDISTDFLSWYPSQQASAVWADVIRIGDNTSSFTPQDLGFDWGFGFRLGAGYNLEYDQWDTQLYWTWFRTEAHQSVTVFPQFLIIATQEIHPELFAGDLSKQDAESAKIRWTLLYNMFDWELGRNYWVSKGLALRPFLGLKGGWIHQPIDVQYKNLIVTDSFGISVPVGGSSIEHAKNNFWGIGPLGGVNTKWKIHNFGTHYPSLFGDFSLASLWGAWSCHDVYKDTFGTKVVVNMNRLTLGALMFKGLLGVGWDVDFNKGKSHFAARLGYEMQLWLNQLRLPTSQLVVLHGDLTLQGVTLNGRFDF